MKNVKMSITAFLISIFYICTVSAQKKSAIEPITVYYHERVPYLKLKKDGGISGLYADPLVFAFENAKVPYTLSMMPSKRQMVYLEENRGRICLVGWYKNEEREKFAQYSQYIYQDKKRIAIARSDNAKLMSGGTVGSVISKPDIKILIKSGYSYGKFLDAQFKKYNPDFETAYVENIRMLKMIHEGRGDILFMSQEEANALIAESGFPRDDFKYIYFSDMPPGYKRYMLFSKQVESDTITKLNREISNYFKRLENN